MSEVERRLTHALIELLERFMIVEARSEQNVIETRYRTNLQITIQGLRSLLNEYERSSTR